MKKYDGWVIKSFYAKNPFLLIGTFHETRKEVIDWYEISVEPFWEKERRKGYLKIVKVRLVEVEAGK